jgi:hypothetical protein
MQGGLGEVYTHPTPFSHVCSNKNVLEKTRMYSKVSYKDPKKPKTIDLHVGGMVVL